MPGTWSIRVLGVLLAAFGVWAAARFPSEYRAALLGRLDGMALTVSMLEAGGDLAAPSSYRGQRTVMEACQRVADGLALPLQPEGVRSLLSQGCRDQAQSILARSPSLALPRVIGARALLEDGDAEAGRVELRRAQVAAPTTAWLAQRRMELGLAHLEALDDASRAAVEADVALLATLPAGSSALAAQFIANEPARDLIASGVEQASGRDQNRFLDAIRAQGG